MARSVLFEDLEFDHAGQAMLGRKRASTYGHRTAVDDAADAAFARGDMAALRQLVAVGAYNSTAIRKALRRSSATMAELSRQARRMLLAGKPRIEATLHLL